MIDSHCHINDEMFINSADDYIIDAVKEGVNNFLVVGFDLKSSRNAVDIAEKHPECYAAIGYHPTDGAKANDNDFLELEKLTSSNKVIAIGEIGLDYYWEKDPNVREKQKENFIKQIEIANKFNLPILVHCRDAIEDCLTILKKFPVNRGGIMHCYAGSYESAIEFIKLGFVLGFGGTVTFKNSIKPKEVISKIPANSYVLETDAPYLTPEPYRGKPNHSKFLKYVRQTVATLRNITEEQVDKESTENFNKLFNL